MPRCTAAIPCLNRLSTGFCTFLLWRCEVTLVKDRMLRCFCRAKEDASPSWYRISSHMMNVLSSIGHRFFQGCLVIFFSDFLALMIKAEVTDADSNGSALYSVCLVAVNVLLVLSVWWNIWATTSALFSRSHVQVRTHCHKPLHLFDGRLLCSCCARMHSLMSSSWRASINLRRSSMLGTDRLQVEHGRTLQRMGVTCAAGRSALH